MGLPRCAAGLSMAAVYVKATGVLSPRMLVPGLVCRPGIVVLGYNKQNTDPAMRESAMYLFDIVLHVTAASGPSGIAL